ncbi:hypothetical protein BKA82DRAFT_3497331 [Pisolithus tinctorius]|nr:hypothetical protein BKA82DRAFT_3497331 [Pisolithus tinctorius]
MTLGCTVLLLSCLAANRFTGIESLATAGGMLGIFCAFGAYYGGLSMLWTKQTTCSFIRLPHLTLSPSHA